jgi:hypothetical protein
MYPLVVMEPCGEEHILLQVFSSTIKQYIFSHHIIFHVLQQLVEA